MSVARFFRFVNVSLLLVSGFVACADGSPTGATRDALLIVQWLNAATVRSVIIQVSGPGIGTPVVVNVPVGSDSTARDTITLTAGSGRRVIVTAVDSAGIATHRADTTIALAAGANAPLQLRLLPLISSLGITVTFGNVSVSVADTSARQLFVGDSTQLSATGVNGNGIAVAADSLTWGTSNPALFTVERGRVRALRPGVGSVVVSYHGAAVSVPVTVVGDPEGGLPTNGLQAFYPFNGSVQDVSGNGRHYTNSGGTFVAGRDGASSSAIAFAALNSHITREWSDFPIDGFTVALWARIVGPYNFNKYSFFEWGSDIAPTPYRGVNIGIDANWQALSCAGPDSAYSIQFEVGPYLTSPSLVPNPYLMPSPCTQYSVVNSWNHIVLTASGGIARTYWNGELFSTFNYSEPVPTLSSTSWVGNLTNSQSSLTTRMVDDLAVWNRVLSPAEIRAVRLAAP